MTEGCFFRRTALVAVAAAIGLRMWTSRGEGSLPDILPFGEPWLTIISIVAGWTLIVLAAHFIRWLYLGISGRSPDLGHR
jgi:hypothetical protein